ncbi:hypothetical protein [Escherichia coli]|uniref:hypothetical protein n=1 Tax=Escherichia coli TaxID=562 RepID=UPI00211385D9|nr:hypothetical protein [Escherichia coli]MCQ6887471.1 hypothetical protein [Escherichia coli]
MKVASIVAFASLLVPSIATAGVNNWSTIAYNTAAYQILCEVKDSTFTLSPWISSPEDDGKYKLLVRHECDFSKLSSYISQEKLNSIIDTHPEYATRHTQAYTKSFNNITQDREAARATLVGSPRKKPGSTPYNSSTAIVTGYYDSIKYVGVTKYQSNASSDGTFPLMALPSTIPDQSYTTKDNAGLILQRISDNTNTQTFPVSFNIKITKRGSSPDNCRIRLPNAITFTSRDQKEVLLDTDGNCTSIWNNSASVKGSIKFIEPSGTDLQLSGISGLDWNKSIQPTGKIYLSPGKTKNGEYNINTEVTYP